MTVFFFGTVKLTHLINRHNPNISKYEQLSEFNIEERAFDVTQKNFQIAFALYDLLTEKPIKGTKWYGAINEIGLSDEFLV